MSAALFSSLAINSTVCCLISGERCSYRSNSRLRRPVSLRINGLRDSAQEEDRRGHVPEVMNAEVLELFTGASTRSVEAVSHIPWHFPTMY